MKLFIVALVFGLSGCASLMRGSEPQPVRVIDDKQQIMFTTCSGAVEEWGSCNSKARKACANGYEAVKKEESPVGGKRELTFKCK
jgi:uncharacterized protein YceK